MVITIPRPVHGELRECWVRYRRLEPDGMQFSQYVAYILDVGLHGVRDALDTEEAARERKST